MLSIKRQINTKLVCLAVFARNVIFHLGLRIMFSRAREIAKVLTISQSGTYLEKKRSRHVSEHFGGVGIL